MPTKGKGKSKGKVKQNPHRNEPENTIFGCILPKNIVFEILSRLPVKSLLRFRCVCKHWLKLISNSKLIVRHWKNSAKSLLLQCNPLGNYRAFLLENPTMDAAEEPVYLRSPCSDFGFVGVPFSMECMDVVGSTFGVICLSSPTRGGGYIIWNPSTRKVRCVPPWDVKEFLNLPAKDDFTSLGFAYDSAANDFEIVKVLGVSPEREIPGCAFYFSTKFSCWRRVNNNIGFCVIGGKCDTIVQGFPFWRASVRKGEEVCEDIIWFVPVRQRFAQMPMPDHVKKERFKRLVDYKDTLAMVVWDDPEMHYMDFWVFKDKVWTKTFYLGPIFGIERIIGFRTKGELILEKADGIIVLHDVEDKGNKSFRIDGVMAGFFEAFNFAETLASFAGEQKMMAT